MKYLKRSAIHNLRISTNRPDHDVGEGLILPESLMQAADIVPYEQVIVTNIRGDNWRNRIHSFAIPGNEGNVIACGSLRHLVRAEDLFCLITRTLLPDDPWKAYIKGEIPLVDVGFDPASVHDYSIGNASIILEYPEKKVPVSEIPPSFLSVREHSFPRMGLAHLVQGLIVTDTHEDCLQGSAEIPGEFMKMAGLLKYQGIIVYNASIGGAAETYVVSMPKGVVMTTGAMANFAPKGNTVNVSAYESGQDFQPKIVHAIQNDAEKSRLLSYADS